METYLSGTPWLEAFLRTVWMDIDFNAARKASECNTLQDSPQGLGMETPYSRLLEPFDSAIDTTRDEDEWESQAPDIPLKNISLQMQEWAHDCSGGRTLFFSRKGYMGVGPRDISVGDTICVLYGGRVPYVLRKAASDTHSALQDDCVVDRWNFLGDAYVHGLMDGEALDLAAKNEAESRDFTLI